MKLRSDRPLSGFWRWRGPGQTRIWPGPPPEDRARPGRPPTGFPLIFRRSSEFAADRERNWGVSASQFFQTFHRRHRRTLYARNEEKSCCGVTMRVTIFIVYGGIHVVVYLDGKIERRMCDICFTICFSEAEVAKSAPFPAQPSPAEVAKSSPSPEAPLRGPA